MKNFPNNDSSNYVLEKRLGQKQSSYLLMGLNFTFVYYPIK